MVHANLVIGFSFTFHTGIRSLQVRGEVSPAGLNNIRQRGDTDGALTTSRALAVQVQANVRRTADVSLAGDAAPGPHPSVLGCFHDNDLIMFTARLELVELAELSTICI